MPGGEFERSWQARYDRWGAKYAEDHLVAGWSQEGLSRRLALVLRLIHVLPIKPGSLLLDLGAGPGTYTRAINNIGHRCLGLDYSRKVIEVARRKGSREIYIQGEAYNLPFRSNVFDAVVCIGVLQSLEQPVYAFNEMARILAPGGHLLLDGLNSLFWMHRLRAWKESRSGNGKRMNYMNPYEVLREIEQVGLLGDELRWLAVPKVLQRYAPGSTGIASLLFARFAGYAFLLHGQKAHTGEKKFDHERPGCKRNSLGGADVASPNAALNLIRHSFNSARATPQATMGDVTEAPGLATTCTFTCPRFLVSRPSPTV